MTPQETDPDLPMTVPESLVEIWLGGGLLQDWVTLSTVGHALLKEVTIIFTTSTRVWPQVKQEGGNRALPINRKLD